jgi:hypothetical protein
VMHQTIDRGSRFSLNFARFSSSGKRESSSIASIRELSQSVTIANLEPLKVSRFCARHKKVYRGFMGGGPPKTRASPNFRATAQTGAAIAARYDSFDGDPLETHWAPQKIRRSNCRHTQPEGRVAPRSTTAHSAPLHLTKSPNNPRRTPTQASITDCRLLPNGRKQA